MISPLMILSHITFVYDSYRGRADSENRIKELKNDFSIDDFITHNFWATEACGSFIVMEYNFEVILTFIICLN